MLKKFTLEEEKEFEKQKKLLNEVNEIISSPILDFELSKKWDKPRFESKTSSQKLTNYRIVIDYAVFWDFRQAFLELLKRFLLKEIAGITFRSEFCHLRSQTMLKVDKLCKTIEEDHERIPDFHYTSKSQDFSSAVDNIYLEIDKYDPDLEDSNWNKIIYSESKLRSVIQEDYLPILKKSCGLDDSFFQSKIDLD